MVNICVWFAGPCLSTPEEKVQPPLFFLLVFLIGEIIEQIITPASGGTPAVRVFGEVQQRTKSSDILSKIWVSNIGSDGTTETKTFTTGATITGKESGFTGTIATTILYCYTTAAADTVATTIVLPL